VCYSLTTFPLTPFSLSLVVRARDVRLSRSVVPYKQLALVSRVSISSGSEREGIVRHAVVVSILRGRIRCLQIGTARGERIKVFSFIGTKRTRRDFPVVKYNNPVD